MVFFQDAVRIFRMLVIVRTEEFYTDKSPCCSNYTHYQFQVIKEFTNDCCC